MKEKSASTSAAARASAATAVTASTGTAVRASAGTAARARWVWALVFGLALLAGWRLQAVRWQHRSETTSIAIEDRREHRFRDFTYSQTQRLLDHLLRSAYTAPTGRERALALARVAALQRERGLQEAAAAAAREALQLGGSDPTVRAILSGPLRLEEIEAPK